MSDVRTRTLVNLYIRDRLYIVYEEMARDLGCSVDYLLTRQCALMHDNEI